MLEEDLGLYETDSTAKLPVEASLLRKPKRKAKTEEPVTDSIKEEEDEEKEIKVEEQDVDNPATPDRSATEDESSVDVDDPKSESQPPESEAKEKLVQSAVTAGGTDRKESSITESEDDEL